MNETAAKKLAPNDVFGRYRILSVVGQGGMGTVYLAEDIELGRQVALKMPRFGTGCDEVMMARFLREARIAARLSHPNLCPVFDVGQIDGRHFLTMPYLKGEPLSSVIKRQGRLPQRTAVRIAYQIAEAIEVAHRAGIVHRDLKPSNLMIDERGEPTIMDFGLAIRPDPDDPRITDSGVILGTPAYAPPEQIVGERDTIGPAADVYSLGAILFEMLTGRLPFDGSYREMVRQIITDPPRAPSRVRPEIPAKLDALCLRALAKEPRDRFTSMGEFAESLGKWLKETAAEIEDDLSAEVEDSGLPSTKPGAISADYDASTAEHETRAGADRRTVTKLARPHKRRWLIPALGGVAVVTLAVLIWALTRNDKSQTANPNPPAKEPIEPPPKIAPKINTDRLAAGSKWAGTFKFLPPIENYTGDVEITIIHRDGDTFRGTYRTEQGQYEWGVAGTLQGEKIHWEFTQVIKEMQPRGLTGNAYVSGTLVGTTMKVTFKRRDIETVAEMTLTLRDTSVP